MYFKKYCILSTLRCTSLNSLWPWEVHLHTNLSNILWRKSNLWFSWLLQSWLGWLHFLLNIILRCKVREILSLWCKTWKFQGLLHKKLEDIYIHFMLYIKLYFPYKGRELWCECGKGESGKCWKVKQFENFLNLNFNNINM